MQPKHVDYTVMLWSLSGELPSTPVDGDYHTGPWLPFSSLDFPGCTKTIGRTTWVDSTVEPAIGARVRFYLRPSSGLSNGCNELLHPKLRTTRSIRDVTRQ
jgi:hypothetical protein